jgi:hypothetical protein
MFRRAKVDGSLSLYTTAGLLIPKHRTLFVDTPVSCKITRIPAAASPASAVVRRKVTSRRDGGRSQSRAKCAT